MGEDFDNLTFPRDRKVASWRDIVLLVAILLLLAVTIITQLFSLSKVFGSSMIDTLHHGDILICSRTDRRFERGDLATIKVTEGVDKILIKRIVGLPGDRIVFKCTMTGEVTFYRDTGDGFEIVVEDYLKDDIMRGSRFLAQNKFRLGVYKLYFGDIADIYKHQEFIITLGEGEFFLMGDNRNDSSDSRNYGAFKEENMTGKVVKKFTKGDMGYGFFNFICSMFIPTETDEQ